MDSVRRPVLRCAECSAPFTAKHPDAAFCEPRCRDRWHKRQASRGQALMPVALAWRGARNRKGDADLARLAMNEMCRLLDAHAAEDRAAGRAPVIDVAKRRLRRNGAIARG